MPQPDALELSTMPEKTHKLLSTGTWLAVAAAICLAFVITGLIKANVKSTEKQVR